MSTIFDYNMRIATTQELGTQPVKKITGLNRKNPKNPKTLKLLNSKKIQTPYG